MYVGKDAHLGSASGSVVPMYPGDCGAREGTYDEVDEDRDAERFQEASRGGLDLFNVVCGY